jgi:hypothetical protein
LGEGQERREARYSERVGLGGVRVECVCSQYHGADLVYCYALSSTKIRHALRVLSKKNIFPLLPSLFFSLVYFTLFVVSSSETSMEQQHQTRTIGGVLQFSSLSFP